MSNFVKVKNKEGYFILNTETVESVFSTDTGSTINHPGSNRTITSATFDTVAAALIPAEAMKSVTGSDGKPQEPAEPETPIQEMKPSQLRPFALDVTEFSVYRFILDFDLELKHQYVDISFRMLARAIRSAIQEAASYLETNPNEGADSEELNKIIRRRVQYWLAAQRSASSL